MIGYTENVPNGPNNPSDDWTPMHDNTNAIPNWTSIDHVGYNLAAPPNAGWHNLIHQQNQTVGGQIAWDPVLGSGVPAAITATKIANVQQTFPLNYTPDTTGGTADTQLFTMTGNGGISQLTGNFATTEGYVWSGGLLFQWGRVIGVTFVLNSRTGTVTFKDRGAAPSTIPFPNNCFNVQLTQNLVAGGGSFTPNSFNNLFVKSISNTSFDWQWVNNWTSAGGATFNFYWFAIGN